MGADDIASIVSRLDRLETGQSAMSDRMGALESARAADLASIPGIVINILKSEMPALVRDNVRLVVNEERIVADAQRFRSILSLGRKVGMAVLITVAGALAVAALNGWFLT